jgi:PAS domain-containing protein
MYPPAFRRLTSGLGSEMARRLLKGGKVAAHKIQRGRLADSGGGNSRVRRRAIWRAIKHKRVGGVGALGAGDDDGTRGGSGADASDGLSGFLPQLFEQIYQTQDLDKVLEWLLNQAKARLGALRGDIVMLDDKHRLVVRKVIVTDEERSLKEGQACPKQSCMWTVFNDPLQVDTLLVPDVARHEHYYCSDRRVKYEAVVPFAFNGNRVGLLNVERGKSNDCEGRHTPFTPDEGNMLRRLADRAGIALHVFDVQRRQADLEERLLTDSPPKGRTGLRSTLEDILGVVKEDYGFTAGLIYIVEGDRLNVRGWLGRPRHTFGYSLTEDSFVGGIYRTSRPDWVADARRAPVDKVNPRGAHKFRISGPLIGMPLRFRGQVVGVLVCWSDRAAPRPAEYHKKHLRPLATLAAWKIGVFQAETGQAEQFKLFTSLVERLPFRVFRKDAQHRFTYANQEFLNHLKRNSFERDVKGRTDFDFYKDPLPRKFQHGDDVVMNTRQPRAINERNQLKDSSEIVDVRGFKAPILKGGKAIGVQGMFWDYSMEDRLAKQRGAIMALMGGALKAVTGKRELSEQARVLIAELNALLPKEGTRYRENRQPGDRSRGPSLNTDCQSVLDAMHHVLSKKPRKLRDFATNGEIQEEIDWQSVGDPGVRPDQKEANRRRQVWVYKRLNSLKGYRRVHVVGRRTKGKWYLGPGTPQPSAVSPEPIDRPPKTVGTTNVVTLEDEDTATGNDD